jgi:hypothetical protein
MNVVENIFDGNLGRFSGIPMSPDMFRGFDRNKAHQLGVLIVSAYLQYEQQGEGSWSIPEGYNLVQQLTHDRKRKLFGFVAIKDREAFIIIRGTRTAYEWYNNAAIKYNEYISTDGDGKKKIWGVTTKGFYSIYTDLREEIKEALKKLEEKFDSIFVAGHSLGGALATLTIPDLIDLGIPKYKITVYTFASPRCGDRELTNNLNNSGVKHWRIANTEDIVPTLPGATANIFSPEGTVSPNERDDDNFIVKTYNNLKSRGMKTFEHTGTPIYFTIGTNSIQDNHNLEIVYMKGIGQPPATVPKD